jgi:hypothetical protein
MVDRWAVQPTRLNFSGQRLSWVDSALENLTLVSSRYSSPETHAQLRRVQKWRKPAHREELMALLQRARVGDDEAMTPAMRSQMVENLIMSAVAVLLISEEISTSCMTEMAELRRVAASWEWFSTQPKRVAIAAWFMRGQTIHQMYLQCDQQRDEARSQRATMARTVARLRRAVSYWESASSLARIQVALTKHLNVLDSIIEPDSLDELFEKVAENATTPHSPVPYGSTPQSPVPYGLSVTRAASLVARVRLLPRNAL